MGTENTQILDSMNQKINFILSAVSGTKENITQEDVENIAYENDVLTETLAVEEDILYSQNVEAEKEIDDMLVQTVAFKIVNNVLINMGEYNDADSEDLEAIITNSVIDEEDVELLLKRKDDVLFALETHKTEEYYQNLISTVEELTNG